MPIPSKIADLIPALDLIPHPEGGFFVESFRSGCKPMSTRGQTGMEDSCREPDINLVVASRRAGNRPDGDERRNALTSIFWAPTLRSPTLMMTSNCSDHVHYYHGGRPFRYYLFDPVAGELSTAVVGPELREGQRLQLPVRGGVWKCGRMEGDGGHGGGCDGVDDHDYSLIGEAVAPGFDFHDFAWVTREMVEGTVRDDRVRELLLGYVHGESTGMRGGSKIVEMADEFYEDGAARDRRVAARS